MAAIDHMKPTTPNHPSTHHDDHTEAEIQKENQRYKDALPGGKDNVPPPGAPAS